MTAETFMPVLLQTLKWFTPQENLDQLLREHEGTDGHCTRCHTVSPCTLWTAAMAARYPRPEQSGRL